MMSNRERWIVYPLLFLALAFELKDRMPMSSEIDCRTIRCSELTVTSPNGTPKLRLGSSPTQSGEVRVYGAGGDPALVLHTDQSGRRGQLETFDEKLLTRVVLGSDSAGGYVQFYGKPGLMSLFLGHDAQHKASGLFARSEDDQLFCFSRNGTVIPWGLLLPWFEQPQPEGSSEAVSGDDAPSSPSDPSSAEKVESAVSASPVEEGVSTTVDPGRAPGTSPHEIGDDQGDTDSHEGPADSPE